VRAGGVRRVGGLTLIESMLLLVIMSIVAVAAGIGLQAVAKVPVQTDLQLATNNAMIDALEHYKAQVAAGNITASATAYEDNVTLNTLSYKRSVTVENASPTDGTDPAAFASTQTDFFRITVSLNGQSMRCYVAKL
jgi:type II secretory pathway pseudopilin PulG